ncbi:MAG: hypothetical protein JST55_13585 [Bacteroidetes bacterium]|nr:hypothetical protein [Bacteroidota bacterium]
MNNSPNKLTPVILSASIMVILSSVPLLNLVNTFCCMGIILGGFIGVTYYSRQLISNNLLLTQKDSILIGLLSGIISAVINTGVTLVISLFSKTNPIAEIMDMMSQMGKEMPPEAMQIMEKLSQEFTKFGFSPTLIIITFVMNIILYPLFGMLGSFIAYQIYKKKNLQQPNIPIQ